MSFCSLCRVTATPEHLASGWHKYNDTIFKDGKMPMVESLYEQFEKARITASGETTSPVAASCAPAPTNTKNVNQWHWEEKNVTEWAKERLSTLLQESKIEVQGNGGIKISKVKDFKGDAYLNLRKGKMRVGFELSIEFEWEGEIRDSDDKPIVNCSGKGNIAEISDDMDDDEYEDVIHVSMTKEEKGADALYTVMKKLGRKTIADCVRTVVKELHAMKNQKE